LCRIRLCYLLLLWPLLVLEGRRPSSPPAHHTDTPFKRTPRASPSSLIFPPAPTKCFLPCLEHL
jgi:hypothetical protein